MSDNYLVQASLRQVGSHVQEMAQDGVMSYAIPLQMQCYMFIVGHLDELPSDVIALLPIVIRRKLLLMLPALDICKLEETPVTDGISMDDEIWKWKCNEQGIKLEDMVSWKDSYFCNLMWTKPLLHMLLLGVHIPVACTCAGNIQGLNISKYDVVVSDHYKVYYDGHCSELIKLLVDSDISFKAIRLETFLRRFVGFEIPVECVPLFDKLLDSVIKLVIGYTVHDVPVAVAEKVLSIIFTNNSCQVKYLTVCGGQNLQLISPFITSDPHCKLRNIKVEALNNESLDMLYCILDNQDELEKLEVSCEYSEHLENFKYSTFSRPTFEELTISGDISKDSYIYIMQQFFLSPYPVILKFYESIITTLGSDCLQVPSIQSHPTQQSKTLELSYCWKLVECLPSTVHLKNLVLMGADCVKYFSKLDNITVDERISVSTDNLDDLNDLFHITTAREWNIDVTFCSEDTQDKFIVALNNIKGVVTKLCIYSFHFHLSVAIAEAIFTSLQSSLPQLDLKLESHGCQSSHIEEFYEIWKQCGSIKLKRLTLGDTRYCDYTVRDIEALISNDSMM